MLFDMINLKMNKWSIPQKTPPVNLGESGENNATVIDIEIDENEVSDFLKTKYYLDIRDEVDGEKTTPRTQELALVKITNDNEETYKLQMKPNSQWLGKDNIKLLQVRCEYVDDTDSENTEKVVMKSNTFKGIVKTGLAE